MGQIQYPRGTTYGIGVTYSPDSGIAGDTALFTVKPTPGYDSDPTDLNSSILPPKSVSMANNACNITINPTDIADTVSPTIKYYYDVKVVDVNGDIYLIDTGPFILQGTPTNRTPAT